MFDFVRSHTRLLQGLLVLLIFPSFVFFGVQGYSHFMDQAAATVATLMGSPSARASWMPRIASRWSGCASKCPRWM
jgi:peptidyl-prolyl cis-trans isomerase D